jgi:type I restriction enzyme M protein
MRAKLVASDRVECVLGLGPNLFYNSPMEACIVICRAKKPPARRGKVIFVDALKEVSRERAQSLLTDEHQQRIVEAYRAFKDIPGFAAVATLDDVAAQGHSLSIPLYVKRENGVDTKGDARTLREAWKEFEESGREFWQHMDELEKMLNGMVTSSPSQPPSSQKAVKGPCGGPTRKRR